MNTQIQPNYDANGLAPVILQDSETKRVLMLAYMNSEAYSLTLVNGTCYFFSRSRNEIWHKGATSGNFMNVVSIDLDCDFDAVLIHVRPSGPACHNGTESCFDH